MKVRVVRQCYQPLYPGGESHRFREHDIGRVIDWQGDEKNLPACFETLDLTRVRANKVAKEAAAKAAQARLVAQRAEAEAAEAARLAGEVDEEAGGEPAGEFSGAPPVEEAQGDPMMPREGQINRAFELMDHNDDSQWTVNNEPMVEAVAQRLAQLGYDPNVSRAEVQVANPEFARNSV